MNNIQPDPPKIQTIAALARLHVPEDQLNNMQEQFDTILRYVDVLRTTEFPN
jgi:Asp-tRNA(Asn)/Glu-tRNA(Gln) amidotransferase C subunit